MITFIDTKMDAEYFLKKEIVEFSQKCENPVLTLTIYTGKKDMKYEWKLSDKNSYFTMHILSIQFKKQEIKDPENCKNIQNIVVWKTDKYYCWIKKFAGHCILVKNSVSMLDNVKAVK